MKVLYCNKGNFLTVLTVLTFCMILGMFCRCSACSLSYIFPRTLLWAFTKHFESISVYRVFFKYCWQHYYASRSVVVFDLTDSFYLMYIWHCKPSLSISGLYKFGYPSLGIYSRSGCRVLFMVRFDHIVNEISYNAFWFP